MSLSFSYFCKVLRFALIQRHCLIRPSDVVGIGLIFYSGYFFFFRTIHNRVMTSYPFLKMAATASRFYFRFRFYDFAHLGRSKSTTCRPNFS